MECEQYMELMSAALDGELTAAQRRALEAHLAVCPRCAGLWARLLEQSAALRELDCPVPDGLKTSILSALSPQERPRSRHWKRWAAACACLIVVLGTAAVAGSGFRGANSTASAPDLAPAASTGPMESVSLSGSNESGGDCDWSSSEPEAPDAPPATVCSLAPGALPEGVTLLGSQEALAQLLAPLPAEKRDALAQIYGEDYFGHSALAALVVTAAGEPRLVSLSGDRAVLTLNGSTDDAPSLWLVLAEVGADLHLSDAFETVTEP